MTIDGEGNQPVIEGAKEGTAADSRAIWGAVAKLRELGAGSLADHLKDLADDPVISNRIAELAKEGGYEGGLRSAEASAEEAQLARSE